MINNKYHFVLKHNFVPVVVLDILPPPILAHYWLQWPNKPLLKRPVGSCLREGYSRL